MISYKFRFSRKPHSGNLRKGFTLVETMVSFGIMAFIFSFMAYLTWMSARAFRSIHEQIIVQNQASMAMERVANEMRNSCVFKPVPGDEAIANTNLQRCLFLWPQNGDIYNLTTGKVEFFPSTIPGRNGRLLIYKNASSTQADYAYGLIEDFSIRLESECRVKLSLKFNYSGTRTDHRDTNNDGKLDSSMAGQLITVVSAKSNILLEGLQGNGNTLSLLF